MKYLTPVDEARVKKDIKKWLAEQGAYFFFAVQSGYGSSTLDILACLKGRFIGVEVKSTFGKMTPRQGVIINQIRAAGGLAFVARSVEDVKLALAEPETLTTKAF